MEGGDLAILALDLATKTGWAYSRVDGSGEASGVLKLAGEQPEERAANLIRWIIGFARVSPFDHLVYEAPLPPSFMAGKTNVQTAQLLLALPVAAGAAALLMPRPLPMHRITQARPNDVRKHFIGMSTAGGREQTKRAVIARCRAMGWTPRDDNEADAIALLDYRRALLNSKLAVRATPLFGGMA